MLFTQLGTFSSIVPVGSLYTENGFIDALKPNNDKNAICDNNFRHIIEGFLELIRFSLKIGLDPILILAKKVSVFKLFLEISDRRLLKISDLSVVNLQYYQIYAFGQIQPGVKVVILLEDGREFTTERSQVRSEVAPQVDSY